MSEREYEDCHECVNCKECEDCANCGRCTACVVRDAGLSTEKISKAKAKLRVKHSPDTKLFIWNEEDEQLTVEEYFDKGSNLLF